jgi:hypothetical protein
MLELRDPEYWRSISYQASNNHRLLIEIVRLIDLLEKNDIDIVECCIEIGYRFESVNNLSVASIFSTPAPDDIWNPPRTSSQITENLRGRPVSFLSLRRTLVA